MRATADVGVLVGLILLCRIKPSTAIGGEEINTSSAFFARANRAVMLAVCAETRMHTRVAVRRGRRAHGDRKT